MVERQLQAVEPGPETLPLLSAVVTCYDMARLKDLKELLESLKAQDYPHLEVVFVGERTRELGQAVAAHAEQAGLARLTVVFNDSAPGLSGARNMGAANATGEIVAFIDDDAVAFPGWAREIVQTFADDPMVVGVTGEALPLWEDQAMAWLPVEFYWIVSATAFTGWREMREVRNAWGMNMSFRRSAFDVCRFDESTFGRTAGHNREGKLGPEGDDTEFCLQLRQRTGRRIVYNPQVRVWHKVERWRLSPKVVRRRAFWQGYTRAMIKRLYSSSADGGSPLLKEEYSLLRRIILGLLPRLVLALPVNPRLSWRRLSLSVRALWYLGLGYGCALFPPVGRRIARLI